MGTQSRCFWATPFGVNWCTCHTSWRFYPTSCGGGGGGLTEVKTTLPRGLRCRPEPDGEEKSLSLRLANQENENEQRIFDEKTFLSSDSLILTTVPICIYLLLFVCSILTILSICSVEWSSWERWRKNLIFESIQGRKNFSSPLIGQIRELQTKITKLQGPGWMWAAGIGVTKPYRKLFKAVFYIESYCRPLAELTNCFLQFGLRSLISLARYVPGAGQLHPLRWLLSNARFS